MDKLKKLLSLCKASVEISVNNHRDFYQTVELYIKERSYNDDIIEEIGEDIYNKMVSSNTIIEIQAYPNTPIGSYNIYHYDIDLAIDKMIELCSN